MSLIALAVAAATPQAETPQQFIARVYAKYSDHSFSPLKQAGDYFTAPLSEAMRKDSSGDDVGYLDGDPLCDCQDYEELRAEVRNLRRQGAKAADARVHVTLGPSATRDLTLKLSLTPGGWRIADVIGSDGQSLMRELQRSNAQR